MYDLYYNAEVQYRNRTADSVDLRVVWTSTLSGKTAYNSYGQQLNITVGSMQVGPVVVVPYREWKDPSDSPRSQEGASEWFTVQLNTTSSTNVYVDVYYYCVNSRGTDLTNEYKTHSYEDTLVVKVPAY